MTSYIEFEGKNIEHAIKKACGKLKIDKEKIRYKVISYGSTGIFGLAGRKKAKINVSVPEAKKPEKIKIDNKEEGSAYYESKENELRENNVQTGKEVLQKIIDSIMLEVAAAELEYPNDKFPWAYCEASNGYFFDYFQRCALVACEAGEALEAANKYVFNNSRDIGAIRR